MELCLQPRVKGSTIKSVSSSIKPSSGQLVGSIDKMSVVKVYCKTEPLGNYSYRTSSRSVKYECVESEIRAAKFTIPSTNPP